MLYNIKGRMTDGRTIRGIISGSNPVEACAGFVTKNNLAAAELGEVKLSLVDETSTTAKVRPPRKVKAKTNGATEADKAAGANQLAAVASEEKKEAAAAAPKSPAPQATAPSRRR